MFVREADEAFELGPASTSTRRQAAGSATSTTSGSSRRCSRPGRCRVGRVGLRRRARRVRRPVSRSRGGLHRPERRGDAAARVTRCIEAHGRGSRRARCALERGSGRIRRERPERGGQLGYPVMVKATAGGGGRGHPPGGRARPARRGVPGGDVRSMSAFGDGTVFMEKLVSGARHIEVQIIGDEAGTVWALGVRDCSVQRRNQKIIEEAPSPALSDDQHAEIMEAAARLGRAARIECRHRRVPLRSRRAAALVHGGQRPTSGRAPDHRADHRRRPRQAPDPCCRGRLARGGTTANGRPRHRGAPERRRPGAAFAPAPGTLELLRFPTGPGIRVDTGVEEGDAVARSSIR